MCILMYFGPGQQPIREHLEEGARSNPHGFGWGIVTFDAVTPILTGHSMSAKVAIDEFLVARKEYPHHAALFHARITTSGEQSLFNCHPFFVDGRNDILVAHNGILPCTPQASDNRSDTHIFADDIFMTRWPKLDSKMTRQSLQSWIGYSKLVVLTTAPEYDMQAYIFNEHKGDWFNDDTWYSNDSWKKIARAAHTGYGWSNSWDELDDRPAYVVGGTSRVGSGPATYVMGWIERCDTCLYRRLDCECPLSPPRQFTYRPAKEALRKFVTPVFPGWDCAVCECKDTINVETWRCLVCFYNFCCNQRKELCDCDIRDEFGVVLPEVIGNILREVEASTDSLTERSRKAVQALTAHTVSALALTAGTAPTAAEFLDGVAESLSETEAL